MQLGITQLLVNNNIDILNIKKGKVHHGRIMLKNQKYIIKLTVGEISKYCMAVS